MTVTVLVCAAVGLGACTGSAEPPEAGDTDPSAVATDGELDQLLVELGEAGFCDPADVEQDGFVTAMHFVVGGDLQPACFAAGGADDPRLLDAWDAITTVTPRELYDDVSLLAGYEGCDDCDTLAFVITLDEDASFFLLAVDVQAADQRPDELRLTMLHELSHVITQHPGTQLDATATGPEDCDTYFNGNGCFRPGAHILDWIDRFWSDGALAELPEDGSALADDVALDACHRTGDFVNAYAATHPEEDFAEMFSAYVFDVDLSPAFDEKLSFFDEVPEFAEIRRAAIEAGVAGIEADLEGC
ncbi:MAG: hypothetical protein AAFP84_15230 [Actinomycetota bacterium]